MKNSKILLWLLICLQVIALAVLIYFIYSYIKDTNQDQFIKQLETSNQTTQSDSEGYCPAGFTIEKEGNIITVTGKEKISVGGQEVELCCTEVESEEAGKVKTCQDENGDYMVVIEDDERVESYPQDGQKCIHGFDKNNNELFKLCL